MNDQASTAPGPMGWLGDEGDKRIFSETMSANPDYFSRNPARDVVDQEALNTIRELQSADGIEGGVNLQAIEVLVFGTALQWLAQIIGSCVGSSHERLVTIRTLWESFVLGDPEQIFGTKLVGTNNVSPFAPYTYRAGRKIAGINGGDGSFCSAHIKGAMQYGELPCTTPGIVSDAFPEPQSANTYRQMGNSDSFLNKFAAFGQKHLLKESEKVSDLDTAKTLMTEHFKPLQICSNWAFKPSYTHPSWKFANGDPVVIYTRDRSTSWAHSMSVVAFVYAFGKWWVFIKNSWGMHAHKNGDFFVIEADEFGTWLPDSETMSIGDIDLTDNLLIAA